MDNLKKYFYSSILILFLILGLYLNFELDKEFLSGFGFSGFFVIASIIFFIAIKIISEFLFFKLSGIKKWLIGSFALFTVIASITSIFFVRIYKSESVFQEKDNMNQAIEQANREISQEKSLLLTQVKSLETQINTRKEQISGLDKNKDKWLILRYNKEMTGLSDQRLSLIQQISHIKKAEIPVTQKETSIHSALNRVFGLETDFLTIVVNLIFTIFVDFSLILLCFALSHVLRTDEPEIKAVANSAKVENIIRPVRTLEQQVNPVSRAREEKVNTARSDQELVNILQKKLDKSDLTQAEFASKHLSISKVALWKILTGKTKSLSPAVRERIEQLAV